MFRDEKRALVYRVLESAATFEEAADCFGLAISLGVDNMALFDAIQAKCNRLQGKPVKTHLYEA